MANSSVDFRLVLFNFINLSTGCSLYRFSLLVLFTHSIASLILLHFYIATCAIRSNTKKSLYSAHRV
jgi:hypothetical protein